MTTTSERAGYCCPGFRTPNTDTVLASIFRAAVSGRFGDGAGRLVGLIVPDGYDSGAGVARWRAFQGRSRLSGRGGRFACVQVKAARSRCQPCDIAVAQRQVESIRSRSCRAPRVMRAATCRTR